MLQYNAFSKTAGAEQADRMDVFSQPKTLSSFQAAWCPLTSPLKATPMSPPKLSSPTAADSASASTALPRVLSDPGLIQERAGRYQRLISPLTVRLIAE